ncbi:isochorismatase family protein [Fervidibacillus halotolerans]|uniref:Isochorismatase family protein n=1 Tax=Fervidibacillus halotolerans TaxID=2980027 RepID=A0A9E8M0V5_9BACI|nr:isochorismatase family protein [Fervidibacillus halotolerans]WAA13317.1 isochorismatase family protein [Fervidibacillus halotolerans]
MLKTKYEEIVQVDEIGKKSSRHLNDILPLASQEHIPPAKEDEKKVLLLGIDIQNDFIEGGSLAVPGSKEDVKNLTKFIYQNIDKITKIAVSLDTHQPMQIFHADWWRDEKGNLPEPFTIITAEDVKNGKWIPQAFPDESIDYVIQLERIGKKQLCIWPYHCIEGTYGVGLESQFANIIYFHSIVRKTEVKRIVKGTHPTTEMYGIFRPEYSKEEDTNTALLNEIATFDQIIVAGEAKSHCVLESLAQLIEFFEQNEIPRLKIVVLEDCMSSIPGYEQSTEKAFQQFEKSGVQIVSSKEFKL